MAGGHRGKSPGELVSTAVEQHVCGRVRRLSCVDSLQLKHVEQSFLVKFTVTTLDTSAASAASHLWVPSRHSVHAASTWWPFSDLVWFCSKD